jgi:catechol 2,3-dioxygenase-like lactoylglutathione lyase family enzyme
MRIDHVLLATADLDEEADRVSSEFGWEVSGGGRHEGHGTHNRIVPLGGGYLELIAVADADEAAGSPFGRAVQARVAEGGGLLAWCVLVDDVEAVAARLGTELVTVTRQGLSASITGVEEAMANSSLPFFIARDHGIADPGVNTELDGIELVEVAGDQRRLEDWLGGESLPVQVVEGAPGLRAFRAGGRRLS